MDTLAKRFHAIDAALEKACGEAGRGREEVTLVAVSKRQPDALVWEAYQCGIRDFGENTLQGLEGRMHWAQDRGLDDIRWHFIGQIQSRKAKSIWGLVDVVHTLDRLKLLRAVDAEAVKTQSALVQVNLGAETQKGGVLLSELPALLTESRTLGAKVEGLMCIPPNDGAPERWFSELRELSLKLSNQGFLPKYPMLSMGMSSDFVTAVRYGATLVRVGSSLFGERMTQ